MRFNNKKILTDVSIRKISWLAIFVPGLALGIAGRWSDFLIWIGAAAILGWAIAALANTRAKVRQ